jgi:hypothetical protein
MNVLILSFWIMTLCTPVDGNQRLNKIIASDFKVVVLVFMMETILSANSHVITSK